MTEEFENCEDQQSIMKELKSNRRVLRKSENDSVDHEGADLNILMHAKHKLEAFIFSLEQFSLTPIPGQILDYIEVQSQDYKQLTCSKIMRLTDQRIERMIKNKKVKRNWSVNDVLLLVWIVSKCYEKERFDLESLREQNLIWTNIASLIPGAVPKNCLFKWLSLRKNPILNNTWTKEQQRLLQATVRRIGTNKWKIASRELYEMQRNPHKIYRQPKQCREHWRCFLDPTLRKGSWDPIEDKLLLQIILKGEGSKKWSKICYYFDGRTENSVKNRYRILIDRMKEIQKISLVLSPERELQCIKSFLARQLQNVPSIISQRLSRKRPNVVQNKKAGESQRGIVVEKQSDSQFEQVLDKKQHIGQALIMRELRMEALPQPIQSPCQKQERSFDRKRTVAMNVKLEQKQDSLQVNRLQTTVSSFQSTQSQCYQPTAIPCYNYQMVCQTQIPTYNYQNIYQTQIPSYNYQAVYPTQMYSSPCMYYPYTEGYFSQFNRAYPPYQ